LNLKNELKNKISKLRDTGFFSIFISNIFSKVIAFLGNIVIVKILTKNDYGIYAYAINAMTMLYIFNDFGASNSALQSLTEQKDDKLKQKVILKYALKIGLSGSLLSAILILLSPLFYPFEIVEAKYYTPILCLIPLFTNVNAFISVVLRANLENKKFAILEFSKTLFNYLFLITFSLMYGLIGAIVAQYCYTILGLILGVCLAKNILFKIKDKNKLKLDKEEKKSFIKYSLSTQLNSTLSSILLNIDIFLIGIMIANSEAIATYKVAATIPLALSFLPSCVIIYLLPYFVIHNKDKDWIHRNYIKLIKYGAIAYGIISGGLILFAKPLFYILYGTQYDDAILPFIILMIGFFFNATFKIPTNNILYSMRKLKFNLMVTISASILNFILNIIFIDLIGANGAAISTMMINIISSILLIYYVRKALKGEKNEEYNY